MVALPTNGSSTSTGSAPSTETSSTSRWSPSRSASSVAYHSRMRMTMSGGVVVADVGVGPGGPVRCRREEPDHVAAPHVGLEVEVVLDVGVVGGEHPLVGGAGDDLDGTERPVGAEVEAGVGLVAGAHAGLGVDGPDVEVGAVPTHVGGELDRPAVEHHRLALRDDVDHLGRLAEQELVLHRERLGRRGRLDVGLARQRRLGGGEAGDGGRGRGTRRWRCSGRPWRRARACPGTSSTRWCPGSGPPGTPARRRARPARRR